MVQFASYLRRVLAKTRLIFSRINGPNRKTKTPTFKKKKSIGQFSVIIKLDENRHFCHLGKTCETDLTFFFLYLIIFYFSGNPKVRSHS